MAHIYNNNSFNHNTSKSFHWVGFITANRHLDDKNHHHLGFILGVY
jgi:hypothetical protein